MLVFLFHSRISYSCGLLQTLSVALTYGTRVNKYLVLFFIVFATFGFTHATEKNYSDIKNPGLYSFLTETYQPVSDLKELPADTEKKLEENEKKIQDQRLLDMLNGDEHFHNFKLVLAGISNKSYYIYYQSSLRPVIDHLGVFLKVKNGFCVSYYSQLPANLHNPNLDQIRGLVCGYYRDIEKSKRINSYWAGDFKKGWVNKNKNMKILVSKNLKSVIATDLNGKPLWCSNVIKVMESSGFWRNRSDGKSNMKYIFPNLKDDILQTDDPGMVALYHKGIDSISFGEGIVNVTFGGRCWGEIDLDTGKFTYLGND